MKPFYFLGILLTLWATEMSSGQTQGQLERAYRASVDANNFEDAAKIKIRMGDLDGAARNVRRAILQAKKSKDYVTELRLLDWSSRLEQNIRERDAKAANRNTSKLQPKPREPEPVAAATRWLWSSGGLLTLRTDGVATHDSWKKQGTWSRQATGEIQLVGEGGSFRIVKLSDTAAEVFHSKGGTGLIQKPSDEVMVLERLYKMGNYNGRGDDVIVRFSKDGVGHRWGSPLGKEGVACTWEQTKVGIEIKIAGRGDNSGLVFKLNEEGRISYVYEQFYRRVLPVETVSDVELVDEEADLLIRSNLQGKEWQLKPDSLYGDRFTLNEDGSIGGGKSEAVFTWRVGNGRLFLLSRKEVISRAFRFEPTEESWVADASIKCESPMSPELRLVPSGED